MSNNLHHHHEATRHIRKEFMLAMIAVGKNAINDIQLTYPVIYQAISNRFNKQPSRAAFWLVNDRDAESQLTPLQQLNKGEFSQFTARLFERR